MFKYLLRLVFCLTIVSILFVEDATALKKTSTDAMETYTFERDIRLAPGEFYAVSYDDNLKEFVEFEPDRKYGCLPDRAFKQILRAPTWVREKFADKLVDLYYDDIDVGDNAKPVFLDINDDGQKDLIVQNGRDKMKCFMAPYFKEVDTPIDETIQEQVLKTGRTTSCKRFSVLGSEDGTITVESAQNINQQLKENLNRIKVAGNSYPVFEDVTGDGLPDLLIGSSDGTISVYENYGSHNRWDKDNWWFVSYTPETDSKFDYDVGFLSSPCIADFDNDGINDILSGSKDSPALEIFFGPEYTDKLDFQFDSSSNDFSGGSVPASADFNNDGASDLALGLEDGSIHVFLADPAKQGHRQKSVSRMCILKVPNYATPCAGDFNGDNLIDLAVGSGDGQIHFFANSSTGFNEIEGFFGELEVGEFPSPAEYDFNKDGSTDLVVGNKSGDIKVFLAPDWEEVEGGLGITNAGQYTSPAFGDLTGDKIPEMLIGSLDGTFMYLEGDSNKWIEKYSWQFHPIRGIAKVEDYFLRTHPESTYLRGANDDTALNAYLDVFESCGDEFFDEVAFTIANTQTEILRVMSRLDNADLVFENAKAIYEYASKVKYAKIIEKGDYSTVEYKMPDGTLREMPKDMYYWWVVHPVVEYEFPARVDASYWRHTFDYYGIDIEEWNRKEISIENYEHNTNSHFWRTFLQTDNRYGKNLIDIVEDAEDIWEAVYLISDWIAFSGPRPGKWNEYGKQSNDLQPLVIYEKNYGSCGEQAMLCAAFSRTALIPNAPVGCYGEDHAWNEFWIDGKWYKWDIGNPPFDLGQPWYEGRGHKGTPRLTIARRWPDGRTDNTTTLPVNPPGSNFNPGNAPGYSEVGKVKIRVVDCTNQPVEGALINVRSKWNNNYNTSIWDYTDPEGYCFFELGNPITGSCVVDVITSIGVTGTEYFIVRENEEFEYTYTMPYSFNRRVPIVTRNKMPQNSTDYIDISIDSIDEEQRPVNYAGGRRGRFQDTRVTEKTGYYGTRWYSEPNSHHRGVYSASFSKDDFENYMITHELPSAEWSKNSNKREFFRPESDDVYVLYNPNRYTHVRLNAKFEIEVPNGNPSIEVISAPESAKAGESVTFKGTADDNLHVSALMVSIDGGANFSDITSSYNRETKLFDYTWNTGYSGPIAPGKYNIVFRVEDDADGFMQTNPIEFNLKPTRNFKDQVIYQDNPDNPLLECSWILGPITISTDERFIVIEGYSIEPDFDMDLYLYYDKNQNRVLDGPEEQVGSAAGATAIETMISHDPKQGTYWIYCQGWQVKERKDIDPWQDFRNMSSGELYSIPVSDVEKKTAYALLDVNLSFDYKPAFITDIKPSTEIRIDESQITGRILDGFQVNKNDFNITFDGRDISDQVTIKDGEFVITLSGFMLEPDKEYVLEINAKTVNENRDHVTLNLMAKPPELAAISHSIDNEALMMSVKIDIIDDGDSLEKAKVWIDDMLSEKLKISDDSKSAECEISLKKLKSGEHKLVVEYRVTDKESITKEIAFKYNKKSSKESLLSLQPGDGAKVFDHQSILIAYYALEIKDDVESVKVYLDNKDITSLSKPYDEGVIYIPQQLYTKGEHIFMVVVTLNDGRVIESESTFTVMSMDDEDEPKQQN